MIQLKIAHLELNNKHPLHLQYLKGDNLIKRFCCYYNSYIVSIQLQQSEGEIWGRGNHTGQNLIPSL